MKEDLNMRNTTYEDLERYATLLEHKRDEARKMATTLDEQLRAIRTILDTHANASPLDVAESTPLPTMAITPDMTLKESALRFLQSNPGKRFRAPEIAENIKRLGFVPQSSTFIQSVYIALNRMAKPKGPINKHTDKSETGVKTTYFWMEE